jgi:hypothetical protein
MKFWDVTYPLQKRTSFLVCPLEKKITNDVFEIFYLELKKNDIFIHQKKIN